MTRRKTLTRKQAVEAGQLAFGFDVPTRRRRPPTYGPEAQAIRARRAAMTPDELTKYDAQVRARLTGQCGSAGTPEGWHQRGLHERYVELLETLPPLISPDDDRERRLQRAHERQRIVNDTALEVLLSDPPATSMHIVCDDHGYVTFGCNREALRYWLMQRPEYRGRVPPPPPRLWVCPWARKPCDRQDLHRVVGHVRVLYYYVPPQRTIHLPMDVPVEPVGDGRVYELCCVQALYAMKRRYEAEMSYRRPDGTGGWYEVEVVLSDSPEAQREIEVFFGARACNEVPA